MKNLGISKPLMSICCALFLISCVSCHSVGGGYVIASHPPPPHSTHSHGGWHAKNGPPAHAPAHGYRAQHRYRYYHDVEIYFDIERHLYFYQEGGSWCASARLPRHLRVRLGDFVTIAMETDKPYKQHKHHKSKYPPGHAMKPKKHKKDKKWTRFF